MHIISTIKIINKDILKAYIIYMLQFMRMTYMHNTFFLIIILIFIINPFNNIMLI